MLGPEVNEVTRKNARPHKSAKHAEAECRCLSHGILQWTVRFFLFLKDARVVVLLNGSGITCTSGRLGIDAKGAVSVTSKKSINCLLALGLGSAAVCSGLG